MSRPSFDDFFFEVYYLFWISRVLIGDLIRPYIYYGFELSCTELRDEIGHRTVTELLPMEIGSVTVPSQIYKVQLIAQLINHNSQ